LQLNDCISKVGPNFADHQWRSFESGIVEVQAKQEGLLNEAEKIALEPFLIDPQIIDIQVQEVDEVESY
jgi:hypothetical protein